MYHGSTRFGVRLEPGGGQTMEFWQPFGERSLCFQSQQIAEQVVVAEPLAGAVQADDELIAVSDVVEPVRAVR